MPKMRASEVAKVGPGRFQMGDGLTLLVQPSGSRSWCQRISIEGERINIGLGGYPAVGVAAARAKAIKNRAKALDGIDPRGERRQRRPVEVASAAPTFEDAAAATFAVHQARWRSDKTRRAWDQHMGRYVLPVLGSKPIDKIGRRDVLAVLEPIWTTKPAIAKAIKTKIAAVIQWAIGCEHLDKDPLALIGGALPKQQAKAANHKAIPHAEIGGALVVVAATKAPATAKAALRFLTLTGTRSNETLRATWAEIDRDAAVWTIPPGRMKSAREFRVPLSPAALAVLDAMTEHRGQDDLVFPSLAVKGRPLSNVALTRVLQDAGLAGRGTVHGMRSSLRDWAADSGRPREVAEAALAHVVGGTEGAYFRSDLFAQRRELMAAWADYIT